VAAVATVAESVAVAAAVREEGSDCCWGGRRRRLLLTGRRRLLLAPVTAVRLWLRVSGREGGCGGIFTKKTDSGVLAQEDLLTKCTD
jgi:hypothetical protein